MLSFQPSPGKIRRWRYTVFDLQKLDECMHLNKTKNKLQLV